MKEVLQGNLCFRKQWVSPADKADCPSDLTRKFITSFRSCRSRASLNQDSFPLAIISAFEVLSTIDIAIDIISYHVNSTDRRGILGIKLRVPLMQGTLAPSKGGLARLTISHDGWVQIRAIGVLLPKCFESVLESAVVMTFLKPYASARLRVFSLFIPRARMFLSANLSKRPLNGV